MTVGMYSGGACSFFACYRHRCDVLLFSDTGIEDEDLYRFLKEGAEFLKAELVIVRAPYSFDEMILRHKALPNNRMPFCSKELKHRPARKWIKQNAPDADLVFGLDWTETHRKPKVEKRWPGHKIICPMMDPPYLMKNQILDEIEKLGIKPPRLYEMGFQHNNCGGGCVRGGIAAWMHLKRKMPERFEEWVKREELVPGKSFLKTQRENVKKPLPLSKLEAYYNRDRDAFDWGGCGCFIDDNG